MNRVEVLGLFLPQNGRDFLRVKRGFGEFDKGRLTLEFVPTLCQTLRGNATCGIE
jgi:hypothetical protein